MFLHVLCKKVFYCILLAILDFIAIFMQRQSGLEFGASCTLSGKSIYYEIVKYLKLLFSNYPKGITLTFSISACFETRNDFLRTFVQFCN